MVNLNQCHSKLSFVRTTSQKTMPLMSPLYFWQRLTVHVTSYLRKFADFCGNPSRIFVKVCAESGRFPWKSVQKVAISVKVCAESRGSSVAGRRIIFRDPRNRLLGSAELSVGNPRNCLSGALGFVLWESSKRSLGDRRLSSLRNRHADEIKQQCTVLNKQCHSRYNHGLFKNDY